MTDVLSLRDQELVALGAALGSNCVPCVQYHISQARKIGVSDAEIAHAIRLADKVRQVPARKALETATGLLRAAETGSPGCGCTPATEAGSSCCG